MDILPARFDPTLEAQYLETRRLDLIAIGRWGAAFGVVNFVTLGLWAEILQPGSWAETLPVRLAVAAVLVAIVLVATDRRSVAEVHLLGVVGFAVAGAGWAVVLAPVDGGFLAGVAGLTVALGLVSIGPLTHRAALSALVVAIVGPVVVYVALDATTVELVNLVVWMGSGFGFAYIAWRLVDQTRRRVFLAERELSIERDKVDALVRRMVPGAIADRLKAGERSISDRHDDVTVLFLDIVGFTRFSEARDPAEIVGLLNELFGRFDGLVAERRLEKIKTLGDGYMVAGGAPEARPDHAVETVRLAMDLQDALGRFAAERDLDWHARIGIHSGPVVAGVIGTDRYAYDLWGDTVNVASRLESTGAIDSIHISADTMSRLDGRFELEPLGRIELKNREPVEAYVVRREGR